MMVIIGILRQSHLLLIIPLLYCSFDRSQHSFFSIQNDGLTNWVSVAKLVHNHGALNFM